MQSSSMAASSQTSHFPAPRKKIAADGKSYDMVSEILVCLYIFFSGIDAFGTERVFRGHW